MLGGHSTNHTAIGQEHNSQQGHFSTVASQPPRISSLHPCLSASCIMHTLLTPPGDMITEEALPTYMAMLNTLDGVRDETGASPMPWAQWTRLWTAEENRHGDLMSKYIYLTGR